MHSSIPKKTSTGRITISTDTENQTLTTQGLMTVTAYVAFCCFCLSVSHVTATATGCSDGALLSTPTSTCLDDARLLFEFPTATGPGLLCHHGAVSDVEVFCHHDLPHGLMARFQERYPRTRNLRQEGSAGSSPSGGFTQSLDQHL